MVGSASLPATNSTAELREAKRRISLHPVHGGTGMTVRISNVTLTARRDGIVLARERTDYAVTVAIPVLAMHERTRRYERRLNAGLLDGPGLGRQLTWRLTAVAEARGLVQYGGAPVQNVLANRHVELSTNAAMLREQRAVYGHADADGRAGLVRATARVGTADLLGPTVHRGPAWTEMVLSAGAAGVTESGALPAPPERTTDSNVRVGVNRSADVGFAAFLREDLDRVTRRAYSARVTRRVRVVSSRERPQPEPTPPGRNWTLVDERESESATVIDRSVRRTPSPREFLDVTLTVRVTHGAVRTWRNGVHFEQTRVEWVEEHEVRIRVEGDTVSLRRAPDRRVAPAFVRGGALDGPNLADVGAVARQRLGDRERLDDLARTAATDGDGTTTAVIVGARPAELESWMYADVAALRERVRNVSVNISRADVAAGEANAAGALAAKLSDRRSSLVAAPASYDGVADRARVAARAAYLDRVIARLEARARTAGDRNAAYRRALEEAGVPLTRQLDEVSHATAETLAPEPHPIGSGLAGEIVLTPDADPGYLTLTAVSGERPGGSNRTRPVHPLAARNTNVFTVPADEAADSVTDAVLDDRTTSLRTAGLALRGANRTLAARENRSLRHQRDLLAFEVATATAHVGTRASRTLADRAGGRLSPRDRRAALRAADARFEGLGGRALAMTNGSYADVLAREAVARGEFSPMEADRLAVHLRIAVAAAASSERVSVSSGVLNGTVTARRRVARSLLHDVAAAGTERAAARLRDRYAGQQFAPVLAGLPVAPMPGYWYATVNVWTVEVRGYYPQFTVEAHTGPPDGAGAVLRYVRDGRPVRFDADGDGELEHVGRNERVSFRTRTVVLVAVPAGRSGVGDVDGNADERSAGWPCPHGSVPTCENSQ